MTKKEIIFWLEDKRNQKIGEKEAEAKEKQREIYKEVLAPLGFYEAASQIKEHLQQALEIWRGWKKTQGPTALGFAFRDYLGFEQQTIRWLEGEMPFEAFLEEHDIFLSPNLFQELNQEKGETIHNIHLTYNTVTLVAVFRKRIVDDGPCFLVMAMLLHQRQRPFKQDPWGVALCLGNGVFLCVSFRHFPSSLLLRAFLLLFQLVQVPHQLLHPCRRFLRISQIIPDHNDLPADAIRIGIGDDLPTTAVEFFQFHASAPF